MTCPVCFFREDHQKQLKKQTFGIARFENKLTKYKEIFIDGVHHLGSLSDCKCHSTYNLVEMIAWTDSFLTELKNSENEINSAFNNIISVYEDFISKNQKIAIDSLWRHLENQGLLNQAESSHTYTNTKLLFRGRPKGGFDEQDIKQYFHIPFSKRHLVNNQRFSVSGQPMIYFGSSVLAITKELGHNVTELAVAGFLPRYSAYYHSKIFNLTNRIGDLIENSLPGLVSAGVNMPYQQENISSDIHKAVLFHLCTFPTEVKGGFVAEYVIPQILTTALLEQGYVGIVFPSTKDYAELNGNHRFSSHHLNIGMFVPYSKSSDTNEEMLNTFATFSLDGRERGGLTTSEIIKKIDDISSVIKNSVHNNNDYAIPIGSLKLQVEYMDESSIHGIKYFDTDFGKLELELYMKMLCHLQGQIK